LLDLLESLTKFKKDDTFLTKKYKKTCIDNQQVKKLSAN